MNAKRKVFLVLVASTEASAGIGLLFIPSVVFGLLLGLETTTLDATFVGRIAGAALIAIGVASWVARSDELNRSMIGLLVGILIYNASVAILLICAPILFDMTGSLLWPTIGIHATLTVWGGLLLRGIPRKEPIKSEDLP